MAVKRYYSTKNNQKVQVGWKVEFKWASRDFGKFHTRDKAKAQALNDRIVRERRANQDRSWCKAYEKSLLDVLDDYIKYIEGSPSEAFYKKAYKSLIEVLPNINCGKFLRMRAIDIGRHNFHQIIRAVAEAKPDRLHYSAEIDLLRTALNRFADTETDDFKLCVGKRTLKEYYKQKNHELISSLSPEEAERALLQMKERDFLEFALFVTQFIFGDRVGEARGYYISYIDFENGLIYKVGQVPAEDKNLELGSIKHFRLKERPGIRMTKGICPRLNIRHVALMAFYFDVVQVAKQRTMDLPERFLFTRPTSGLPVCYNTYKKHLKLTGEYQEKGLATHKNRKSTKSLAELFTSDNGVKDATRKLLRHSNQATESLYLDRRMIGAYSEVPIKLFSEYVLPIYKPSQKAVEFAISKLKNRGLKVV